MPIYEYNCQKCHNHFEMFQKITDASVAKCPQCGNQAKRIMSQTSFSLKGGGWYKDGYTSRKQEAGGKKQEEKKEQKTEKKSEKKEQKSKE